MNNTDVSNLTFARRNELHLLRKVWHMTTGGFGIYLYYKLSWPIEYWGYLALGIAAFGFTIDFIRLKNEKFNQIVLKFGRPLMRRSEKNSFSGLPFYALGAGLCCLFFNEKLAILSLLFMVIADPISSLVGVTIGKDKILPNKSLQGTVACFVTCFFISFLYMFEIVGPKVELILFSLGAGIVGACSELLSAFNIDDNLSIPILSGLGLTLLNYLFEFI